MSRSKRQQKRGKHQGRTIPTNKRDPRQCAHTVWGICIPCSLGPQYHPRFISRTPMPTAL